MGLLFAAPLALSLLTCENTAQRQNLPVVQVLRCYDGDTCTTRQNQKIRLVGIDAPEKKGTLGGAGQTGAEEAKVALQKMVIGQKVSLIDHGKDRYGRILGEFCLETNSVNVSLIQEGFARAYTGKAWPKTVDVELFKTAESRAKKLKIGVWKRDDGGIDPSSYRKMLKSQR
jgi:micrococcal nuclease